MNEGVSEGVSEGGVGGGGWGGGGWGGGGHSFSMHYSGTCCHCLISIRFLGMQIIHYSHPIMSVMASQMTGVSIVYWTLC